MLFGFKQAGLKVTCLKSPILKGKKITKKHIIVNSLWHAMSSKYGVTCQIVFLAAVFSSNTFFLNAGSSSPE